MAQTATQRGKVVLVVDDSKVALFAYLDERDLLRER